MDICVINLAHREDRRSRAREQLASAGLDFEFFPAVNRAEGYSHFEGIDRFSCFLSLGRQPSDAEVGCFASHLSLWHRCAERGKPVLVMEDDFRLTENFADAVALVARHIDRFGFIRLDSLARGRFREQHARRVATFGDLHIDYLLRVPLNATAYALAPRAATRLIAACKRFPAPTDNFFQCNWGVGQPIFAVRPEPVDLDPTAEVSSIVESDRDRKTPLHRAGRLIRAPYRVLAATRRDRFNRRVLRELESGSSKIG